MSNARFLYTFKFDTGTITSSSEVTGLPDDNAVHAFVARVWRTTGDTSEWIKFDMGSAKKITMVAIFGHNLTSGATVTVEANSSDSWTTPAYTATITWNERVLVKFLDQTYRWWRITFADAANPDGYIEIGRICAGEYVEPDVNVTEEVSKRVVDPSTRRESEGRQVYTVEKNEYRVYGVRFTGISRTQQSQLETMFRSVKTIRPLVFALDPDNYPADETIYCIITTPLEFSLGALAYGDVDLTFEEMVS